MGKPAKRNSFFKVMLGDFKCHLRIPSEFKKHLSKIREKSLLRSALGGPWRVKFRRSGSEWFLEDGWKTFVSDHSIASGDFLLFFYDGNYGFDVKVYGKSGCEKEAAALLASPCKIKKAAIGSRNTKKSTTSECVPAITSVVGRFQRERAVLAIKSFQTTNPFFTITMSRSSSILLTIPRAIVRECRMLEKKSVILRDLVGNSWHAQLSCRRDGRVMLSTGWPEVYRGKGLREGDVCLFELFQQGNEMHVHIFRVKEETEFLVEKSIGIEGASQMVAESGGSVYSERRPLPSIDCKMVRQLVKSIGTKNSIFGAPWRRFRQYDLLFPAYVNRELDLKGKRTTILLDPHGREWKVKISKWRNGKAGLGSGYSNFLKGNHIGQGDACIFELVQGVDIIKVHIFRGEANAFEHGV